MSVVPASPGSCRASATAGGEDLRGRRVGTVHVSREHEGDGAQRDDRDQALEKHAAIGNRLRLAFPVKLLGRRAGGDEAMEPEMAPHAMVMKSAGKRKPLAATFDVPAVAAKPVKAGSPGRRATHDARPDDADEASAIMP